MHLLLVLVPTFTSEQQPLRLNPAEISEVIAEVCSETTSNANQLNAPSKLTTQSRQPSADVAFNVLINLVIDMYRMDAGAAADLLTLYMLEGPAGKGIAEKQDWSLLICYSW